MELLFSQKLSASTCSQRYKRLVLINQLRYFCQLVYCALKLSLPRVARFGLIALFLVFASYVLFCAVVRAHPFAIFTY